MSQNFSSKGKSVFSAFYKIWRELIFPPFCAHCEEISTTKLFCFDCWSLCSSPDPIEKCPHCFQDSEGLCFDCRKGPYLPFPQAYVFEDTEPSRLLAAQGSDIAADFAIYSWVGLDWEMPDVIIPMPGSEEIALCFAERLEKPLVHLFAGFWEKYSNVDAVGENKVVLFINERSSLEECKQAIQSLSVVFPKKGYLLNLYPSHFKI